MVSGLYHSLKTTTEWQPYTMFSAAHTLDWLNLHLLISPFGVFTIVMTMIAANQLRLSLFETDPERDFSLYLGTASALLSTLYVGVESRLRRAQGLGPLRPVRLCLHYVCRIPLRPTIS